jgi:H+/gluconate symporter-like permease
MYEGMGRTHAWLVQERGQGTVEYVGLVLLLGVILAGVVAASGGFSDEEIAKTVVAKLKQAIKSVGDDGE